MPRQPQTQRPVLSGGALQILRITLMLLQAIVVLMSKVINIAMKITSVLVEQEEYRFQEPSGPPLDEGRGPGPGPSLPAPHDDSGPSDDHHTDGEEDKQDSEDADSTVSGDSQKTLLMTKVIATGVSVRSPFTWAFRSDHHDGRFRFQ